MVEKVTMFDWEADRTELTVIVALSSVGDLLLCLCIAHTWAFWRQVKWYVVLLAVGNCLEFLFRFSLALSGYLGEGGRGTAAACKSFMALRMLSMALPVMAVAALSVHVLLTAVTRRQGDAKRHAVVVGLFSLLSLPLALAQIPLFDKETVPHQSDQTPPCLSFQFFYKEDLDYYHLGESIVLVFFPLVVILTCLVATLAISWSENRGQAKGEDHPSDFVLTSLLGLLVLLCCVPLRVFWIFVSFDDNATFISAKEALRALDTYTKLSDLEHTRNILSAVVIVVFAYVNAFRNRGEGYISPERAAYNYGERQKLVN